MSTPRTGKERLAVSDCLGRNWRDESAASSSPLPTRLMALDPVGPATLAREAAMAYHLAALMDKYESVRLGRRAGALGKNSGTACVGELLFSAHSPRTGAALAPRAPRPIGSASAHRPDAVAGASIRGISSDL